MSWKMAPSTLPLLIWIPAKGDQFGLHPDGRKLLSGKLDKSIMGWDQSEAPALAM